MMSPLSFLRTRFHFMGAASLDPRPGSLVQAVLAGIEAVVARVLAGFDPVLLRLPAAPKRRLQIA